MEENLLFIETCLKKYEYPNIYGADIGEILGETNRIFLLSWLYKLIQGEDSSQEVTREDLSNFLNAYGFCSTSQTKKFIEVVLDYHVQLQIFKRIFRMLDTVKKKYEYHEHSDEMSFNMLGTFVRKDVNIFKLFGNLKILEINKNKDTSLYSAREKYSDKEFEKLNDFSGMKEKINCAAKVVSDVLKHKEIDDLDISLEDDYMDILKEFNENVLKAKKFIKNIEIMNDLKNTEIFDQMVIQEEIEHEYLGMAKEIVKLIHELQ